jgi:hypothetical protein
MDKITLTKKAFIRWVSSMGFKDEDNQNHSWQSLVAESQRPELIERWATVNKQGMVVGTYLFEDQARKEALDYYRVILLREVVGV